jgi:hypothetical protein
MTKIQFSGDYLKQGANFIHTDTGLHLVFAHRHTSTATKPPEYLLLKSGGKFIYVSSLYRTETAGAFAFDYDNTSYTMTITGDRAKINLTN